MDNLFAFIALEADYQITAKITARGLTRSGYLARHVTRAPIDHDHLFFGGNRRAYRIIGF